MIIPVQCWYLSILDTQKTLTSRITGIPDCTLELGCFPGFVASV